MFLLDSRDKGWHERTLEASDHPTLKKLWAKSRSIGAKRHELQSMFIRWPWAVVVGDAFTQDMILSLFWELSNGKCSFLAMVINNQNMHFSIGELFFRRVPEGYNTVHYGIAITKDSPMKPCIDMW